MLAIAVIAAIVSASTRLAAAGEPHGDDDRPRSPDRITAALRRCIEGKASLADVQVDVFWSGERATTARIFGDGVGIWQRSAQFRLSKAEVLDVLKEIQRARFGSMPDQFGEDEEAGNEGPRLKGKLVVRAGAIRKGVQQLVDGDQSPQLARLVAKILGICAGPAEKGIGAASMADALRLLAAGTLSPEVLALSVQQRPDAKGPPGSDRGWTLRLAGLRVRVEPAEPDKSPDAARELTLSAADFQALVALLADSDPAALPQSLYAPRYTDLQVAVFKFSRTIGGRRFLGMTPETHGEKQKVFDRLIEALRALHARAQSEGKRVPEVTE